jgi:endoglucanase
MALRKQTRAFLDELMSTAGPAGFEADAQAVVSAYLTRRLGKKGDIQTDRNDNVVATVRAGRTPHVALLGHVDTIGLIVTRVGGDGNLRVGMIGRPNAEALVGQVVTVHAASGPIRGVVFRAVDGEKKADVGDLAIDCGFADAKKAARLIRVGDCVSWSAEPRELADGRLIGPATDDRVGVVAACETLSAVAGDRRSAAPAVSAVSCIMEEGPTHMGAIYTMSRLKPDLILVLDTIGADDYRGCDGVRLGGGPVIARGGANHNRTSDAMIALARKLKIPHQLEAVGRGTGTDLESALQFAGGSAVGLCVSIPHRHYHTPNEMFDPADLELTVKLLAGFLTRLPKTF